MSTCYHGRMLLFHGTTAQALDAILHQGLQPPQPGAAWHDRKKALARRKPPLFRACGEALGRGSFLFSLACARMFGRTLAPCQLNRVCRFQGKSLP
jgi:hypothetical protein